jgi:cytochrome b
MSQTVKVWDFAIRFFHWSQVLLLAGLWYTGEEGLIVQHQLMAFTLLALVGARLIWGVFGSQTARFSYFAATPATALRYLRRPTAVVGHNPAAFYMILLLLLLTLVQLLSGLATFDNSYMLDGPLVKLLPTAWVDIASDIHKLNINILLAAVAVHIIASLWHSLRVHNVLWVMLTGKDKLVNRPEPQLKHSMAFFFWFLLLLGGLYFWHGAKLLTLL